MGSHSRVSHQRPANGWTKLATRVASRLHHSSLKQSPVTKNQSNSRMKKAKKRTYRPSSSALGLIRPFMCTQHNSNEPKLNIITSTITVNDQVQQTVVEVKKKIYRPSSSVLELVRPFMGKLENCNETKINSLTSKSTGIDQDKKKLYRPSGAALGLIRPFMGQLINCETDLKCITSNMRYRPSSEARKAIRPFK